MGQGIRSILLSVAAASFIANGAQGVVGTNSASASVGGVDQSSIDYHQSGNMVTGISFKVASSSGPVSIQLNGDGSWQPCSSDGTNVNCSIDPRPVTDVNQLQVKTA
jgi:hypothetical protein